MQNGCIIGDDIRFLIIMGMGSKIGAYFRIIMGLGFRVFSASKTKEVFDPPLRARGKGIVCDLSFCYLGRAVDLFRQITLQAALPEPRKYVESWPFGLYEWVWVGYCPHPVTVGSD